MSLSPAQCVREARRALDCGRALFRENLIPECHRYFVEALDALLAAWTPQPVEAPASDTAPLDRNAQALAALERAGFERIGALRAVLTTHPGTGNEPDEHDRTAGAARPLALDVVWAEIERLHRFTVWRWDPPLRRPRLRVLAGAAVGIVLVLMVVVSWRLWGRTVATASASYSSQHGAAQAIDGVEATEWLLPDSKLGWLQIEFPSPRAVHKVRLLNAHNIYYMDRGCERVRVTLYCQFKFVAAGEGTFPSIESGHPALDFDLSSDCVTRVRIDVLSYFKRGGGLAEVEVE